MKKHALLSLLSLLAALALSLSLLGGCGGDTMVMLRQYFAEYGEEAFDPDENKYYLIDGLLTSGENTFYLCAESYDFAFYLNIMKNSECLLVVEFPAARGAFNVLFAYGTSFGAKAAIDGSFAFDGTALTFSSTSGEATEEQKSAYALTAAELLHILLQYADEHLLSGSGVTVNDLGFLKY